METERGLEAQDNNHTEIKKLLQNVSYEIARRTSVKNQEMQVERRQSMGDPNQINEIQLLQIQRGIDDIKALLMSSQSKNTGPLVKRYLGNSSLASSYSFLNREVRKLLVLYLH